MESEQDYHECVEYFRHINVHANDVEKLLRILKVTINSFTEQLLPIESKSECGEAVESMFEERNFKERMPPGIDVFHEHKTASEKNLV